MPNLPPLRLLSLDGGGVRGLSSLMILQDIMEDISSEEKKLKLRDKNDYTPLKPCDYFDLIGGTSTGGIIAILLSRLRLDVPTCIKIYTGLAEKVFKDDRSISLLGLSFRIAAARFSGEVLETAIKKVLKDYGFDPEERMWDDTLFVDPGLESVNRKPTNELPKMEVTEDGKVQEVLTGSNGTAMNSTKRSLSQTRRGTEPGTPTEPRQIVKRSTTTATEKKPGGAGCHGLVVAVYKHAVGMPKLFLTSDANDQTKIWQALRATSAAPTFFEEITFGSPKVTYIDGGLGYNSPCVEVDSQAKSIWRGRAVGCVVSVGTGLQTIPSIPNSTRWLPLGLHNMHNDLSVASAIVQMATSTTRVDNEMQRMYRDTDTEYYRWDVDTGLSDISLEQWMKEDEMASATKRYMEDPDQKIRRTKVANTLARLTADPRVVECSAERFKIGLRGDELTARDPANPSMPCWLLEDLDLNTGYPLGMNPYGADEKDLSEKRKSVEGSVLPVEIDLDGDGNRSEARTITCTRAENICLRTLISGVPQGRYNLRFIVYFYKQDPTSPIDSPRIRNFHNAWPKPQGAGATSINAHADVEPPINLVFSAGRPYDPKTFTHRYVDPAISADIVPVILHPDAIRVRIDEDMWNRRQGEGWFEIEGDAEMNVGLHGDVGIVISKVFEKEKRWTGGWSFGGVRLVPVRGD